MSDEPLLDRVLEAAAKATQWRCLGDISEADVQQAKVDLIALREKAWMYDELCK